MTRIYVPLDKDMTDEEIVRALQDAATQHNAEKKVRQGADRVVEVPADDESDE